MLRDGISIVICCYNSEWIIARCLEALERQDLPLGFNWEIILVDNNCADNTVRIAESCMCGSGVEFRIVEERKSGLANARVRGVAEAKYKYIVFCDDDNLLCPNYVQYVYEKLESDSRIGAIGGKGIPEFECEPDPRILPRLEGYAVGSQLRHKNWLFGAGMALRTDLVRNVYEKQELFLVGRKGGELLAGDDSELAYSIVLRGYKTYPTDDVYYVHVLRSNRLTMEYYRKMNAGFDMARPPLEVMRSVLEGTGFTSVLWRYFRLRLSLLKYMILFWHKQSACIRMNCRKEIDYMKSWGLWKLWYIYQEWMRIKKHAENTPLWQ